MTKQVKKILAIVVVTAIILFTGSMVYAATMPNNRYQNGTNSLNQKERFHHNNYGQTERSNHCHEMMNVDRNDR
ncbi:hypothetical protein JNUCC83_11575 [Vagococcus sp. JNUCC 83]